ncbi:MAG: ABC transporter ATP-binding protein [Gammaproteobacteria bacterium]|nr:ABC transporter ATP-binding protein [Gammaproteobacteria bacterium]
MKLAARNLALYAHGNNSRCLCDNLNVEFEAGQNWAILGANGSGKTRLLHTLAGLRPADAGDVLLNDVRLSSYAPKQRARNIGVLFQDMEIFPATVLETALAGRHPHAPDHGWQRFLPMESDTDRQLAMDAIRHMALDHMVDRDITSLSGGERRRADIATLLAQDAPICMLDEATNDLDLRHQVSVLERFATRAKTPGHLNLFILHDINLALRYCSHALMIFENGHIETGTLPGCLDTETLARLYGCKFEQLNTDQGAIYLPAG